MFKPRKYLSTGVIASSIFVLSNAVSINTYAQNYPIVQILKRNASSFAIDGGSGGENGQDAYLYSENENNVNQRWNEIDRGNGYYSYQKFGTNYCLDGNHGGANAQNAYLWTCMTNNQNQHWRKVSVDGNYYRLEKRNASNYSLDGNRGGSNRQSVYLWTSNNNNQNQHWSFNYVDEGNSTSGGTDGGTTGALDVNCSGAYELEECIDNMADNGGGTVILDSKTYYLNDSVLLQSNVNIRGQGSSTLITWDNSVASSINKPLLTRTSGTLDNVVMQDFKMSCQVDTRDDGEKNRTNTRGVYVVGDGSQFNASSLQHSNITMERVEITQCGGEGIQLKGLDTFTGIDLYFYDNGWGTTDLWHNIYLKRVRNVTIKQTSASSGGFNDSPSGHGMRMSDLDNVYFENITISGNADHGLHMDNVSDLRGHSLNIEGNCADQNGLCGPARCYNSCDYDLNAGKE